MTDTITGRLLTDAQARTDRVIKENNLSKAETTLLENQSLILKFIQEDHGKIGKMWEDFEEREAQKVRIDKYGTPILVALLILAATDIFSFIVNTVPKLQALP